MGPGETGPTGPCFVVGARGYLDFEERFSSTQQEVGLRWALGIGRGVYSVYDANGLRWDLKHVESAYRRKWWLVLLARTGFAATIAATLRWHEPTEYSLEELRKAFMQAVDEDDDSLTQFAEARDIHQRVAVARSFAELADVFRWMQAEHFVDEDEVG
jgi:hypothetical protein